MSKAHQLGAKWRLVSTSPQAPRLVQHPIRPRTCRRTMLPAHSTFDGIQLVECPSRAPFSQTLGVSSSFDPDRSASRPPPRQELSISIRWPRALVPRGARQIAGYIYHRCANKLRSKFNNAFSPCWLDAFYGALIPPPSLSRCGAKSKIDDVCRGAGRLIRCGLPSSLVQLSGPSSERIKQTNGIVKVVRPFER